MSVSSLVFYRPTSADERSDDRNAWCRTLCSSWGSSLPLMSEVVLMVVVTEVVAVAVAAAATAESACALLCEADSLSSRARPQA